MNSALIETIAKALYRAYDQGERDATGGFRYGPDWAELRAEEQAPHRDEATDLLGNLAREQWATQHRITKVVRPCRDMLDATNEARLNSALEVVSRTVTAWLP